MTAGATPTASRSTQSVDRKRLLAQAQAAYAENEMDVVLDLSSQLLETDPHNVVALKLTARVHTQRGENSLAEPIWRQLWATGPDRIEPTLGLARIAYSRGDWDAAAKLTDLAVHESGDRPDALRLAIAARVKAKNPHGLADLLIRLRDAQPDRFAAALKTLGSPELAQAQASVLARLSAIDPVDPALESLARECRKSWEVRARRAESNRDDDVRASYLRAIWSVDPGAREAVDGLNALCRERLRFLRLAIKKGDEETALQQAEDIARFNPTLFEAWFAIARLTAVSNARRSAECFHICAVMKPDDVYFRFQQGLALVKSNQPAHAILAFTTVVAGAENATDPITSAALAKIAGLRPTVINRAIEEAQVGRLEEARFCYRAATNSVTQGGGVAPAGARATFWAHMSAAHIRIAVTSLRRDAAALWKRAKTRSARLKRRIAGRVLSATVQPGSAASTRG